MYVGCQTPHPLELSTNYKGKHGKGGGRKGRENREEIEKTREIIVAEDRLRIQFIFHSSILILDSSFS